MKIAVLDFPGSAAADVYYALQDWVRQGRTRQDSVLPDSTFSEHSLADDLNWEVVVDCVDVGRDDTDLFAYDCLLLPGGFSYGDYLRPGAIARLAPIMEGVIQAAEEGKFILGVGNGFQILLEAGLLPGVMRRNADLKFRCLSTAVEVVYNQTAFTREYTQGETVTIPIAHEAGNYYCDQTTLQQLEANQQIVFRYKQNPNGSIADIAGIINARGNVLGMMPHPERALEELLGSADGQRLFTSIFSAWREKNVTV